MHGVFFWCDVQNLPCTYFSQTEEGLLLAQRCTAVLFKSSVETLASLTEAELNDLFRVAPKTEIHLEPGTTVMETVMKAKCFGREGIRLNIIMYLCYRMFLES